MLHAIDAQRAVIAIEDNKPEAAAQSRAAVPLPATSAVSGASGGDSQRDPLVLRQPVSFDCFTGLEVPAEGRSPPSPCL